MVVDLGGWKRMAYELLAGSCDSGPCPAFHRDGVTGDVKVQGYITGSPVPLPSGEDVVHIPAEAWARLLSRLPVGMPLRALFTRSLRRLVLQPKQQ
jgi:hypothetical protein